MQVIRLIVAVYYQCCYFLYMVAFTQYV